MAHVPLHWILLGLPFPLFPLTTKSAAGKFGASTTTGCSEAQTSPAQAQPSGPALLGSRAPLLVRLEAGSPGSHSRDRGPLASCWFPSVLESDLPGEPASGKKDRVQGGQESDLSDGRREPDLAATW